MYHSGDDLLAPLTSLATLPMNKQAKEQQKTGLTLFPSNTVTLVYVVTIWNVDFSIQSLGKVFMLTNRTMCELQTYSKNAMAKIVHCSETKGTYPLPLPFLDRSAITLNPSHCATPGNRQM